MKNKFLIFLGIISTGVLGIFIYPTVLFHQHFPDLGMLAWFHLIPLLLVLSHLKGFKFFGAAALAGLISYGGTLYWLALAMKNFGGLVPREAIGVLFLILIILALYFSLALSFAFWVHRRIGWPLFILIPVFLLSFDFLRKYFPVGGFPWPMASYSQGGFLPYFQWVDILGAYGLSFFIFLVNALFADLLLCWKRREFDVVLTRGVILVLVVLISFYASILDQRHCDRTTQNVGVLHLALIQGNISQEMKWDPQSARENILRYLNLSRQAASEGAEIAVWPETAYPYTVDLSDLSSVRLFDADLLPLPTLLGAVSQWPTITAAVPLYYNSAFMVGTDGLVTSFYHKMHLVPFGEYVPMKDWLVFARRLTTSVGDFERGPHPSLLSFNNFKLGTLICYEDIFSDISRAFVKEGADFLVNISNDAWYGDSSASYQHLVFSQFRALENRRYVVRATNTGMTAVIDIHGDILKEFPPTLEGALVWPLSVEKKEAPYTRWGDWVAWGCVILGCVSLLVSFFQKGKMLVVKQEKYITQS